MYFKLCYYYRFGYWTFELNMIHFDTHFLDTPPPYYNLNFNVLLPKPLNIPNQP